MLAGDVEIWNITYWAGAIGLELRVALRQQRPGTAPRAPQSK
jgi:hypothetical protein